MFLCHEQALHDYVLCVDRIALTLGHRSTHAHIYTANRKCKFMHMSEVLCMDAAKRTFIMLLCSQPIQFSGYRVYTFCVQ